MIKSMLIAGLGGFVGTSLRYLVGVVARNWFVTFPTGTFIVNLVGCFIIGIVFGLSGKAGILSQNHVILLATGFCGGFTTFSAFANEALILGSKGDIGISIFYTVASIVFGILFVWLGRWIIS